jgi:hypothetical protein
MGTKCGQQRTIRPRGGGRVRRRKKALFSGTLRVRSYPRKSAFPVIFSNRRRRRVAASRARVSRSLRACFAGSHGYRRRARAETLCGTRTDGEDVVVVLHLRAGLHGHAAHVAGSRRVPSVLGGEAADVRAGARGEHGEGSGAVASSDREAHRSGRTRDESDVCGRRATNGARGVFGEAFLQRCETSAFSDVGRRVRASSLGCRCNLIKKKKNFLTPEWIRSRW